MERYNHLNTYLKEKFGERTLKICIDAGFTCPNRDGTKSVGGCIFCGERGSGEHLKNIDIADQVKQHLESYRGERANKFIVYFQNFTNTYDTLENLKKKYDSALVDDRIVGIQIATRPDCITEDIVKLISSYAEKYYVCVELGLQTVNETTGKLINRCYTNEDFIKAVDVLRKYNIDIVTHIMVGLPGESHQDIVLDVNFINKLDIQGLKIHSTYVTNDTKLNKMYEDGIYSPISLEYYLDELCYIITHIRKDIILHRISGDAPKDMLVAPSWNSHKKLVLNGIDKILRERDLYQGMNYNVEE